jgi:hypothetical protein
MKFGEYEARDADDYMSVRHKEIIQEKSDKFITVPAHMGRFVYKNLTQGLFKEFFKEFEGDT